MASALKGTVRGQTVELDESVGALDGQRVLVVLEPIEDVEVSAEEMQAARRSWVEKGPDGPIDDEDAGGPSFP
jgi:hypothetical protein